MPERINIFDVKNDEPQEIMVKVTGVKNPKVDSFFDIDKYCRQKGYKFTQEGNTLAEIETRDSTRYRIEILSEPFFTLSRKDLEEVIATGISSDVSESRLRVDLSYILAQIGKIYLTNREDLIERESQ